ncbi:MAG TPA: single-stranded-DNA-specific exonuclease RecJ [Gammaproteobacteria bacterium]|nr:single-stranded-DNA-specific exonuclease RecJ [Gammaproteobacteria bacterium]
MKFSVRIQRRQPRCSAELPADLHPVLRRIYLNRKIHGIKELENKLSHLHGLELLSGMSNAVDRLAQAIIDGLKVLVVGDFDADGATSAALAVRAMRAMGASDTGYIVPNRFEYGYGLTPEIVRVASRQNPALLVTVDNGISSIEGVDEANRLGIEVIITDHHLPGPRLPAAAAIVNPNLHDDAFPSKCLAGVGVIFYVMSALRAELRRRGWFGYKSIPEPNMAQYLDLVALGTVADVVPLDHNNRILVDQGLKRIRSGHCVPGISALLRVGGRNQESISASDLAFAVAPRLNAAGRLDDMSLGIECLLSDGMGHAMDLSVKLDELNRQRRDIEQSMGSQAMEILRKRFSNLEQADTPAAICVYDAGWHQGVIGILASRIKDRLHRPVIAFADGGNGELKGSARSINGVHIRDVLDAIATLYPGLLHKFGGHAMAAGLSLRLEHYAEFQRVLAQRVSMITGAQVGENIIWSDGELGADELAIDTARAIYMAGPWGQDFPEPVFDGVFDLADKRIVGSNHLKLVLHHAASGKVVEAIAFNQLGDDLRSGSRVRVAYRAETNEYRGFCNLQLNVQYIEPL